MTEALQVNTHKLVVPVLAIHVVRRTIETPTRNIETMGATIDNYFITPDDSRAGKVAHRMSFSEAINRMIF